MKIEILKDFIGNVNGNSVRFKIGSIVEVDDGSADNFIRGHYAKAFLPVKKAAEEVAPVKKLAQKK